MRVIQPVDFVNQFVSLRPKADWRDVQVLEPLVSGIHNQFLRLNRHKFRVKPRPEHLAIEGLPPLIVLVFVGIFESYSRSIGLDLSNIEKHLVNFLIGVGVRAAEVIGLADSLLHL